jgi:hypothetical protein
MSLRTGAVAAAVAAVLSLSSGEALASRVGGQKPSPPKVTSFTGSDSAGAVSFKLVSYPGRFVHSPATRLVESFRFVNTCSAAGTTTLKRKIKVGPKLGFAFEASGVTVKGGFGPKVAHARGTVTAVVGTCDVGPLTFTATS